jgi:YVTN family beta-propeller protein
MVSPALRDVAFVIAALLVFAVTTEEVAGPASASQPGFAATTVRTVIAHDGTSGIGTAPLAVAVDVDRHLAYVTNFSDNTVSVIDTTHDTVATVITHDSSTSIGTGPNGVAVDEQGHQALVANYFDGTVSIIDTTTNRVRGMLGHDLANGIGDGPHGIAVDPLHHQAFVTNALSGTVSVVDLTTDTVSAVIPHDSDFGIGTLPENVAVDAQTHRAYVTNYVDDSLSIIDTATNAVTKMIPRTTAPGAGPAPLGVAVDDVGHRAYVTNSSSGTVMVIDTTTDLVLPGVPHDAVSGIGDSPSGVAVDNLNHRAYVANAGDGTVSIVDTTTNTVVEVMGHDSATGVGRSPQGIAIDPETQQAFVANNFDDTVSVIGIRSTAPVVRLGGADRYAVSAAVSADTFDPGSVPAVFIASGENFPDALSASAVAGTESSPVLLVTHDAIPDVVGAELTRLKPRKIIVMGGTNTIGDAVQTALGAYAGTVIRIAGADRYAVSAALSAAVFSPNVPVAYVASGAVFPDALSGSAAAGNAHGPVLLVDSNGVPAPVAAEIARLHPGRILVLGGPNTVSDAVVAALSSIASTPTTRIGGADRYAVSAAVSAATFTHGARTVYVASGAVFPDALSGSVAAIVNGGPVLLVTRDSIPDAVKGELDRLNPTRIVVLGGPNTVADSVLDQLGAYIA